MSYDWPDTGEEIEGVIAGSHYEIIVEDVPEDQPLESDGIFAVVDEDGTTFLVKSGSNGFKLVDPDTLSAEQYEIYSASIEAESPRARI